MSFSVHAKVIVGVIIREREWCFYVALRCGRMCVCVFNVIGGRRFGGGVLLCRGACLRQLVLVLFETFEHVRTAFLDVLLQGIDLVC